MEKKTVLAIVLSIVVIVIYYSVMQVFFPVKQAGPATKQETSLSVTEPSSSAEAESSAPPVSAVPSEEIEIADVQYVSVNTDLLDVKLSNEGGDIVSFKLKEHRDGDEEVDMILSGNSEAHAFSLALGGRDAGTIKDTFHVTRISDYEIEFSRPYTSGGVPFTLKKTYTFAPGEYMFRLDITVESETAAVPLNFDGESGRTAWTLNFGPQIGPRFKSLDEREEYRRYITYINGKRKEEKVTASQDAIISVPVSWVGIAGKYFTLIAVPDSVVYGYIFSMKDSPDGLDNASRLYIERPAFNSRSQTDTFRFYLGPKTSSTLDAYETNMSIWKDMGDLHLSDAANTSGLGAILNPLEWVLKKLLTLFYKIIPNYGIAIILVTLLVKLILFPLTRKGSESTLRMQGIAPKIKELQEKYKDNPMKLNAEMSALYKKEGYNPLSGCLPMLLQIPIFFAMYNLFNNHFDLRGAVFISGWIPDLSQPEYVYSFAPFKIPILGWSEIRLLPFIYVGSQLLYGRVAQTPDQKGNAQMKMMLYVMPIVFFFVLYNVPSGLLVYWIMSNILTMIQQLAINKYLAKKRAAQAVIEDNVRKVIAPPKKRKRR